MILWLLVFLVFVSFTLYFLQVVALKRKTKEIYSNNYYPPVSIIKPLKGLDDNMFDNLESFCKQDYPEYELILCFQDYNDPAYRVAEKIKTKYPDKVRIIVDSSSHALNPKVKNMIAAYRVSKYEYILISDSNVMVEPDYLKKTVSAMTSETGLVTNLIIGVRGRSLGARFENLQLNTFIILSVCFLDKFLKMPCSIGKSMLMRKRDFEAIGGFNAVKNVLAEDYLIGKLMHEMGKKVVLSSYIIKNVNEYWTLKRFLNRHTRWAKIRWKLGGIKYFTEPLVNPIFFASIIPFIDNFSRNSLLILAGVIFLKILFDLYVNKIVNTSIGLSIILIPLKDLITVAMWFVPLFSCTLTWRGNTYRIGKNTLIIPQERVSAIRVFLNRLKTVFVN